MSPNFKQIPIIDISPLIQPNAQKAGKKNATNAINKACRESGFFYIKNHDVPAGHLENLFAEIKRFFDLPLDEKMKIHIGKSKIFRGYIPVGGERTKGKVDRLEAVDFGHDLPESHPDVRAENRLRGPNQWPENQPAFKQMIEQHWRFMQSIGARITEGLALSLGLEENHFKPFTRKNDCSTRILHYPPQTNRPANENFGDGIGAHIDYGFLTILAQDDVGGLEVKNAAGEWIQAPYIAGTFIVNIGHMTQRWTNDLYKANLHRVRSSGNKSRYSMPFFYEPDFDAVVAPLACCCDDKNPPRYEPFHFGKYVLESFQRSYGAT